MSAARWPIPVMSGPATAGIWLCSVTAGGCRSPVSASPGWLTPPKRGRVSNCHAIAAPGPATCGSRSMRWPGCRKACGFATTTDYHPTGWAGPISRRSSTGWPTSSPRARSAATTATSSAAAFGPGQAQGADPGQRGPNAAADDVAGVAADRARGLEVSQSVEERFDIGPAQPLRYQPVIRADPQAFRQPGQGVDLRPDVAGPAAAMPRQLLAGPHLGGLRQPRLADAGERESPAVTEQGQVPAVAGPLTAGIGQRPADVAAERGQQRSAATS